MLSDGNVNDGDAKDDETGQKFAKWVGYIFLGWLLVMIMGVCTYLVLDWLVF